MAHESAWIERLTGDPYEPFGRGVPASDRWSYSTYVRSVCAGQLEARCMAETHEVAIQMFVTSPIWATSQGQSGCGSNPEHHNVT